MKKEKLRLYLPSEYKKTIYDIDYNLLKKEGYNTIFFDLDNTIADYQTFFPTSLMINLIENVKNLGFNIYILTNNTKKRIKNFKDSFNVTCFESLHKPFTRKIRKKIIEYNIDKSKIVWIGDQVVTDIKCANVLSIKSILVDPIKPSTEKWYTKINRIFERRYMKKIKQEFNEEYNTLGVDTRYAVNR
ncbi:YqeG family HAD IIIA-type phosphatase [bacterium]|nr:YqeG family HAD IIIA-type phosphatase [bacterium]